MMPPGPPMSVSTLLMAVLYCGVPQPIEWPAASTWSKCTKIACGLPLFSKLTVALRTDVSDGNCCSRLA